jgi:hypothetical protein
MKMRLAIVLLLMVFVGCDQEKGRYQMQAIHSNPDEDKVWILDTVTGRVMLCYETAARVGCLEPGWKFPEQGRD